MDGEDDKHDGGAYQTAPHHVDGEQEMMRHAPKKSHTPAQADPNPNHTTPQRGAEAHQADPNPEGLMMMMMMMMMMTLMSLMSLLLQ